jgi:5-methyltetrahydrofolate--homocysteine methyltransferase
VFALLRMIREELGVNTTGGASNVSFGLPNRAAINAHFLSMAIAHGLTSAITNPMEESIKQAILAADMLVGHDDNCLAWISANRKPAADDTQPSARRSRPRTATTG